MLVNYMTISIPYSGKIVLTGTADIMWPTHCNNYALDS